MFDMRKKDYFKDAFDTYFHSAKRASNNQFEYALWFAWGSGAIVIGQGLKGIPAFEVASNSLHNAKCLFELYIQPMISIWCHNWELQEKCSATDKEMVRRISFEKVQTFLDIHSEESCRLYIGFDKELEYFLEKQRNSSAYYVAMFHQRYRECVTGERIVGWDKLTFPIQSFEQFLATFDKSNYVNLDLESSLQALSVITTAGNYMFQEFDRLYKGN